MTDAIAINKNVTCNQSTNEDGTIDVLPSKKLQNGSTIDTSCNIDLLNTTPLDGIIIGNNTSAGYTNHTLQSSHDGFIIEKCLNRTNMTAELCKKEATKANINNKTDSVLKYVYKKSDKEITDSKSKGHSKNSITRRRRSLEIDATTDINDAPPATVDYTTFHDTNKGELAPLLEAPPHKSEHIVKKTDLANFNIETLHQDSNLPKKDTKEAYYLPDDLPHTENQDIKQNHKTVIENGNTSNESDEYDKTVGDKDINESTETSSRESSENNEKIKGTGFHLPHEQQENIKESREDSRELLSPQTDKESEETITYIPKKEDRKENYKHDDNLYENENSHEHNIFRDNHSKKLEKEKYRSDKVNDSYNSQPFGTKKLHDEHLGEFSYENVPFNEKGQVKPTKESQENYDSGEILQTPLKQPLLKTDNSNEFALSPANIESPKGDDLNASNEQPVNINDGEVKPVVELNSEDDSEEVSEESSKEPQNEHLETTEENSNSSEEEQINNKEVNEKIVALNGDEIEKTNVKEQFERIPLNYNHDKKSQKEADRTDSPKNVKADLDETINDGTLDSLTPKQDKYDDNLNIKFDHIAIKLPEINLPDDILSYSYVGTPKKRKNKKKTKGKTFYRYNDDSSEEKQDESKKGRNNADYRPEYYAYNSYKDKDHENYKITNGDDDEDDDLYEKFVRERFGRKGSFEKRSEKLQATESKPSNPELRKSIQTLLKQTEKVRDEAEKSGDPNAGYMWTLEYGENH